MVDFLFVVIELFSLSFTVETVWAAICRSRRFSKGVCHFRRIFDMEGASPTNDCWCQKTRVIAVACGIKISAVHHLVLSQYTRLTHRQTDGQTERQTDGQNCDSNTVHCIICSRTVKFVFKIYGIPFPKNRDPPLIFRIFRRARNSKATLTANNLRNQTR